MTIIIRKTQQTPFLYHQFIIAPLLWTKRLSQSTTPSLFDKSIRLGNAAKAVLVPETWKCSQADKTVSHPSLSSIIYWNTVDAGKKEQNDRLLQDKQILIEEFHRLTVEMRVPLTKYICPVFEGCDTGNYFHLAFTALTDDGKERTIRPFFTNGHIDMVDKATRIAYKTLYQFSQKNNVEVYGGISNSFHNVPSELRNFHTSQKIFMPFRLGIIGSYEETRDYLRERVPLMHPHGVCLLSTLVDDDRSRSTLDKEIPDNPLMRAKRENIEKGYSELFLRFTRGHRQRLKSFPKDVQDKILSSLFKNPMIQQDPSYPVITTFSEQGLKTLAAETGTKFLKTAVIDKPIPSITDKGNPINVRGLIIVPQ